MNLGSVPPPQGGLWDCATAMGSTAPMSASVATGVSKSYVDNSVSMDYVNELEDRVEKLEHLVDKLIIEFMPEYKI